MPAAKQAFPVKTLMDLLEVSRTTVFAWKDAGCPHRRGAKGFEFVLAEVVEWLEKRAEERGRKSAETQDGQSPYNRKLAADAAYRELQVEQLRENLIEAADARQEIDTFVGGFAAVAAGRLQHFEKDIVQTTKPGDARRLTAKIHAALMEGARAYADDLEAQAQSEDEGSPTVDDDETTVAEVA